MLFFSLYRLHVYRDRVGGEGGFLENTIRINLPKGPPLGFGEICVDFWDFERGDPEVVFLLLLIDSTIHLLPPIGHPEALCSRSDILKCYENPKTLGLVEAEPLDVPEC